MHPQGLGQGAMGDGNGNATLAGRAGCVCFDHKCVCMGRGLRGAIMQTLG